MVGIVVVAHGRVAAELVKTTSFIVGREDARITAVTTDPAHGVEAARDAIGEAVARVDAGQGVLILTDMFGGTPSNLSLSFLQEGKVEVLTGVNLPMLVKIVTLKDEMPLAELAAFIKGYGQKNISLASEVLREQSVAPAAKPRKRGEG